MTDQDILARGYKEYPPTPFHNSGIVKCFQKRFDDDNGKKYFIDIHKWDFSGYTDVPDPYPYEYSIQMYKGEDRNAVDLMFHSSWKVEDVEAFVEKMFHEMGMEYYEKWNE